MLQALSESTLHEAARIVRGGGSIAFPTETFYGLGACPLDARAVQRVCEVKGRSMATSSTHREGAPLTSLPRPLLVLIRSRSDLEALVSEITPMAERLMEAFWPGPLTLVFRACAAVPTVLTAGTGTIGVRLSAHLDVRRLLEVVDGPLTGTSANRSGHPPATTAEEVQQALGADLDLILDGGPTPGELPSTVLDVTVTPARLLREGCIPRASLRSILGSLAA